MQDMSMAAMRTGARLAYVVVPLEGTLEREVVEMVKKGEGKKGAMWNMERKKVKVPAGFMVYFPRGHAIRLRSLDELRHYGLSLTQVPIVNLQGLSDPKSAIGQMITSQDERTRKGAWTAMEDQVIKLATAKTGTVLMPEQLRRPDQVLDPV